MNKRYVKATLTVGRKDQGAQYHFTETLEIEENQNALDAVAKWRNSLTRISMEEVTE